MHIWLVESILLKVPLSCDKSREDASSDQTAEPQSVSSFRNGLTEDLFCLHNLSKTETDKQGGTAPPQSVNIMFCTDKHSVWDGVWKVLGVSLLFQ